MSIASLQRYSRSEERRRTAVTAREYGVRPALSTALDRLTGGIHVPEGQGTSVAKLVGPVSELAAVPVAWAGCPP